MQVTNADLSFQNIMKCYRTQPQAVSHVSFFELDTVQIDLVISSFHIHSSKFLFSSNPRRFTEVCYSGEEDESHLVAVEVMVVQEVRLT